MKVNKLTTYMMSVLLAGAFGCTSMKKRIENAQPFVDEINWPKEYEPDKATFYIHNKTHIKAAPKAVWKILIDCELWPNWYKGAKNVRIQTDNKPILDEEVTFTWETMGLNLESTIKEFNAPYRLSWESKHPLIKGYHAWYIIPVEDGCTLITDESQTGFLAVMQSIFLPNKLQRLHDEWLLRIKELSEK